MCTAITFNNGDCYFGRTLDLEYNYNEEIVIAPRNFPFKFRQERPLTLHHSIIGIATVSDGYPLFYDAVNECGLCAAALNFPSESVFFERKPDAVNLASFELIQWLLGKFSNVKEVYQALCNVNITNDSFDGDFSATPLHWMVSDKNGSIVIESVSEGLKVHENPIGVLTNSPQFPWHMTNLSNYINLTSAVPQNRFTPDVTLEPYSKGLGAYGLHGDILMQVTGESSVIDAINAQGGVYMFGTNLPIWALVLIEFVFAITLEMTMGSPCSFKLACKVFDPKSTHPVLFETAIICATVGLMCPAMSFIAAIIYYPFYSGFNVITLLANWLELVCYNFPFAFFTQLFFIQPLIRTVFKFLFRKDIANRKAE